MLPSLFDLLNARYRYFVGMKCTNLDKHLCRLPSCAAVAIYRVVLHSWILEKNFLKKAGTRLSYYV
jgi:hypothetical protein